VGLVGAAGGDDAGCVYAGEYVRRDLLEAEGEAGGSGEWSGGGLPFFASFLQFGDVMEDGGVRDGRVGADDDAVIVVVLHTGGVRRRAKMVENPFDLLLADVRAVHHWLYAGLDEILTGPNALFMLTIAGSIDKENGPIA
jgi:hypothetical protein